MISGGATRALLHAVGKCLPTAVAAVACMFVPVMAGADEGNPNVQGPPTVLSLHDATVLARQKGFDVLVAEADIHAAEADVRTAGALPNPTLAAGPSRRLDCASSTNCPGLWGAFVNLSDEGLIEGAITRKRALRGESARRSLEAVRYGRLDVERVVVARTKIQYVQTAVAVAHLDFARAVAEALQKSADVTRVRYPRIIDEGQLARVEQEALKAQQEVDRAKRTLRQEEVELAFLLGMPPTPAGIAVDPKVLAYRVPDSLAGMDRSALERLAQSSRPDRKRAEAEIAARDAAVTLARRRRFPDISLLVQYQQLGIGNDAPQPPTLSIGVALPLPILDLQKGPIARATAEREAAVIASKRVDATIAADLDAAWNAFVAARAIVERYEKQMLERARKARDITEIQFNAGSASLTDLLDAQRSWVQVNSDYQNELVLYWTAVFQLEQAVGKELVP